MFERQTNSNEILKTMKNSKVFSANVNGTFTQIKAYKKVNAVARFQQLDATIKASDVNVINAQNSHQACVEDLYPEICK
jgi:hypothetical protein